MKFFVVFILTLSISGVVADNWRLSSIFAHDRDSDTLFHGTPNFNRSIIGQFERSIEPRDARYISNSPLPNYRNRVVLETFAQMSKDAYETYYSTSWVPLGTWEQYNRTFTLSGDSAFLRGYLFDNGQGTIVLAFKGDSLTGSTSNNDIDQDRLLFSCCGESLDPAYDCGCGRRQNNQNVCDLDCLRNCVRNRRVSYFQIAHTIFLRVKSLYPNSDIYFTGHSLGGAVAAMLSLNTSYPSVTFGSPPIRNYAWLYGLDTSDYEMNVVPVFNFGSYDDPIFSGSNDCYVCRVNGVPIETRCHLGHVCIWPLARTTDYGSAVQTSNAHSIDTTIRRIQQLLIPECVTKPNCQECLIHNW